MIRYLTDGFCLKFRCKSWCAHILVTLAEQFSEKRRKPSPNADGDIRRIIAQVRARKN
ncbi:hypothetical protein GUO98_002826 [Salmonella enterica]|nr:hypothetical protein [Salmonella enterica]